MKTKGRPVRRDNKNSTLRQDIITLTENKNYSGALKKIQNALLFNPKDSWLMVEAARCYRRLGRQNDAIRYYNLVLNIDPRNAGALNGLGLIHYEQDNFAEAEKCYQRALQVIPAYSACSNNYGVMLHKLDRFDEAITQYENALSHEPGHSDARYGLSSVLAQIKRYEPAEFHLRYLIKHNPADTRSTTALGMILMSQGQYEEGWLLYRGRYAKNNIYRFVNLPAFEKPYWQGEDLCGKSIMVHREQGFGDELQFSRFASRLKREKGAAAVWLVCRDSLSSLMRQLPDIDGVIDQQLHNTIPAFDYWVMLLDLPFYFAQSDAPFAPTPPYFHAQPEDIQRWLLPPRPENGLRVGLVWRGSVGHAKDRFRSLPGLETLLPLFTVPNIVWVSLQKGAGEEEALQPPEDMELLALGHKLQCYGDTAAVIAQLDVVITVDTSVAHLAGAMNRPCWTLLSSVCTDWRWREGEDTTQWYPSMRLFHYDDNQGWDPAILRMRDALMDMVK